MVKVSGLDGAIRHIKQWGFDGPDDGALDQLAAQIAAKVSEEVKDAPTIEEPGEEDMDPDQLDALAKTRFVQFLRKSADAIEAQTNITS